MGFFLCALAIFLLATGGLVALKKRPVLFHYRWLWVSKLFMALPLAAILFVTKDHESHLLADLIFMALVFCERRKAQGYVFLGVTEGAFRNGVHFALKEMSESFEEMLGKIKLKNKNTELNVSRGCLYENYYVSMKDRDDVYLENLTNRMAAYFSSAQIKTNYGNPYSNLVMSMLTFAAAIGLNLTVILTRCFG